MSLLIVEEKANDLFSLVSYDGKKTKFFTNTRVIFIVIRHSRYAASMKVVTSPEAADRDRNYNSDLQNCFFRLLLFLYFLPDSFGFPGFILTPVSNQDF